MHFSGFCNINEDLRCWCSWYSKFLWISDENMFQIHIPDTLQKPESITLSLLFHTRAEAFYFTIKVFDGIIWKFNPVSSWVNCRSSYKLFSLWRFWNFDLSFTTSSESADSLSPVMLISKLCIFSSDQAIQHLQ